MTPASTQDVLPWIEQAILDYQQETFRPMKHYISLWAGARDEIRRLRRRQEPATMQITVGRSVHYTLTKQDCDAIKARRNSYPGAFVGNVPIPGDVCTMTIVKCWPSPGERGTCNGQVQLDGNDTLWVTSVDEGAEPGQWFWPPRA